MTTLKRHHKIILGSFTSFVIIFMIVSGILLNTILTRQNLNYNAINNRITEIQTDTQTKLNELTASLMEARTELNSLDSQFGSIDEEFALLKASAGEDFSGIIEDSIRSVVTIRTDVGQGTGFIITNDGYIVTNAHILFGGRIVQVIDYEQNIIDAEFIGYNEELDVSLLKLSGDYKRLRLANSEKVQIGEKVIAIGNPLGLQFSVSEGIVSATHRRGINDLNIYIQTDAALNPGNSGGPLINKDGKVIGINNFKISGGESLGFALESNYLKDVINEIALENLNISLV